jgi:hypothetical protein
MSRVTVENEIVFVAVSETMRQEALRVMTQLGIDMPVIVSNMHSVEKAVSEYQHAAVFISRGGTAKILESRLMREVVTIVPSATDYFSSLGQCNQGGLNRIGILNYDGSEKEHKQRVFHIGGCTLFENTYNDKNVVAQIEALKEEQIQAVIGSRNAVETANRMGLKGIALTTGDDSIKVAIDQARRLVEAKKRHELLQKEKRGKVAEQFQLLERHIQSSESVLNENIRLAHDLKQISIESRNKVLDFSNKIKAMDKLIRAIEKIAKQINMLGLNAAIEASRSGQYGSGFSVVATEIRKLAVESQQQVSDIDKTIGTIFNDTGEIVHHIEKMALYTSKQ